MNIENSNTEFKREYTSDLRKEIIAFANTNGGVIYIGIADDGTVIGVNDVDMVLSKITNSIRDSILPDITMFLSYDILENSIIKITVSEGTNKPYYISDKGIKPSGVYVRQGASSSPATFEQIRKMIKLTDGDRFENERSLNQNLTFSSTTDEFSKRNIVLEDSQMRTLGIKNSDGLFTNLALLLSDQSTHTIKVACFNGIEKGNFKDRKEFTGGILKVLRDTFDYISLFNKLQATFSGIDRIENYDYPEDALREALLNAIIHREYAFSGSIIINIYDNRIEFISLGGLVAGLNQNDIMLGISQTRNEKLAKIFYRLKHVEAYGTGIRKIMNYYKDSKQVPKITVSDNAFVIEIPNMNYIIKPKKINPQHKLICDFINVHGSITKEQIQNLLNIRQTRAYRIIREMIDNSLIMIDDKSNTKRYILKKGENE